MALIEETVGDRRIRPGFTTTEFKLIRRFSRLRFIDKTIFRKHMARASGKLVGAYNNPSREEKALESATELSADVLLVGQTKVKRAGKKWRASLKLKAINVGNAQLLGALVLTREVAAGNPDAAAQVALDELLAKGGPLLEKQILEKWRAGSSSRVFIGGLSCAEFASRGLVRYLKNIHGVKSVVRRSCRDTRSELEIEAFFSSVALLEKIQNNAPAMGLVFRVEEARGSLLRLKVIRVLN